MARLSVSYACTLVALVAVLAVALPGASASPQAAPLNRVPKTFNISLDLPPQERWKNAVVAIVEEFVRPRSVDGLWAVAAPGSPASVVRACGVVAADACILCDPNCGAAQGWEGTYGAVMGYMQSLLPADIIKLVAPLIGKLTQDMGEYGEEIQVRAAAAARPVHARGLPAPASPALVPAWAGWCRACTTLWRHTLRRTPSSPWAL